MGAFLAGAIAYVFKMMFGGSALSDVEKELVSSTYGLTENMQTGAVSYIYNIILSLAYGIMIIYFLVNMYEGLKFKNLTFEYIVRELIKLLCGYLILTYTMTFMVQIIFLGNQLIDDFVKTKVSANWSSDYTSYKAAVVIIRKYVYNLDPVGQFGVLLRIILPWLLMQLTKIVIYVFCIVRAIEIVVRASIAPIAVADIFHDEKRAKGIAYLKKFAIAVVQGLCIIVIAWAGQLVSSSIMNSNGTVANMKQAMLEQTSQANSELADLESQLDNYIADPTTDAEGWNSSQVASQVQTILNETGKSIYNNAFSLLNMAIVSGVQIATIAVITRSQTFASDVLGD